MPLSRAMDVSEAIEIASVSLTAVYTALLLPELTVNTPEPEAVLIVKAFVKLLRVIVAVSEEKLIAAIFVVVFATLSEML